MPRIPNIFKVFPHAYPSPTFEVDPNSILFKNPKLTKTKRMQTLKLSTPNTTFSSVWHKTSFRKIKQHLKIRRKPNKENNSTMVKDLVNCVNYLCMTFAYEFA
jgi:hypothetical protein